LLAEGGKETAPTSDRIPGPASADDFMYAHKWKRGAGETEATVKEEGFQDRARIQQRRSAIFAGRLNNANAH
jgi:hypothetical protein